MAGCLDDLRISDDEIAELEKRIARGQTTAMDVDLLRLYVDQVRDDMRRER